MKPADHHPAPSHAPDLGAFVRLMLHKTLAHVDSAACPGMAPALRQGCKQALQRLWQRRRPLARLLGQPPRVSQCHAGAADAGTRLSTLDHATVGLHLAASRAARALREQVPPPWRHLDEAANGDAGPRLPWPPTPGLFAQAARCAIEHATPDEALRLAMMEHSIAVLVPEYVALCRRVLTDGAIDVVLPPLGTAGATLQLAARASGQAHSLGRAALEVQTQRCHFDKRQAA